jgi:hypothetical protein
VRQRTGLVVAGAIVLTVPYIIGLSVTNPQRSDDPLNWLFVPAVGPWMALGARHSACNGVTNPRESLCTLNDALSMMGLIMDGMAQTTGATLLIVGLTVPKKILVRERAVRLTVLPVAGGSALGVRGSF